MADDLATLIERMRSRLQDVAGLLDAATEGDLYQAVRDGLEQYDDDAPRVLVADIAGDGVTYDFALPAGYVDGFSRITAVEYPAGQRQPVYLEPTDWHIYRTPTTTKLRLRWHTPTSGETVRVSYTARHTVEDLDGATTTTVPAWHRQAFLALCTARAFSRLAARFVHEQEATLAIDSVERSSKVDQARKLAEALLREYRELVGVRGGEAPAAVRLDWSTSVAGSGAVRLTHRGRTA